MSQERTAQDPLEFIRGMWNSMGFSLPGMVTPTLDIDELDKRIADLKAVEGWLKMNLNMLQMSTQGLEMQRAALAAVKAMSEHAQQPTDAQGAPSEPANPFATAAGMWPWTMMGAAPQPEPPAAAEKPTRTTRKKASSPRKPSADKA